MFICMHRITLTTDERVSVMKGLGFENGFDVSEELQECMW
jgi:hypothetical protein